MTVYPFPTFIDNAATLRPLPAVVDGFVMAHNQRQEVTLVEDVIHPALQIVAIDFRAQPAPVMVFRRKPSRKLWEGALAAMAVRESDRESSLRAEAAEMEGVLDQL